VGDYQRQLFLMDHAGLPLTTVLEQLEILGGEVVPVLRKELAVGRPAHVPDAPTHASLVVARLAAGEHAPEHGALATDHWTGRTAEDDVEAADALSRTGDGAARAAH